MAKKNFIPLALAGGGVALFVGGKKKSPKKKGSSKKKAGDDKSYTFFRTNARHLMVTKGCKSWLIGQSLTPATLKSMPKDAPQDHPLARDMNLFLSEDVASALEGSFEEGMDPLQVSMAAIERMAPSCAFRLEPKASVTEGQAVLFTIVLGYATASMVHLGLADADFIATIAAKYEGRLPHQLMAKIEEYE